MILPTALLMLGVLTAVLGPRLLARADWPDREPVVALWAWQCVIAAVLLCCALSMTFSAAAAWRAVGGRVFATAPRAVVESYTLGTAGLLAQTTAVALACGGLWSAAMLVREVVRARARRRARRAELRVRAPRLPGEQPSSDRLVVLEGERPDAWWLPGSPSRLVVTTAALRRLRADSSTPSSPMSGATRRPGTTGCGTVPRRWRAVSRRCRCSRRSARRCTGWSNSPPTTWRPAASAG
ncbi:hypothetical protein SHKM778_58150 [Streptomyces sp. KM77-8]|uniref:M56 family peptidase n=1 Tax=Streptomyces haneummycinicus TaxID=3074435 RepID=A0AAT9HPD2_9ACTN